MDLFRKVAGTSRTVVVEDDGWRGILPAIVFAFAGVLFLVFLSYRPSDTVAGVGMVFPLSMSETEILEQVGAFDGRVTRFGGFGHMAVVVRDDGMMPKAGDFGALFSLSPLIVSVCFDAETTSGAF
ncbi:hypothetical protein [Thalassospira sp.]|uniref:hypothetical protein n=1 Tax=Thalassospira sp. TaxID=1912094 RepID=UPI003AA83BD6